MARQKKHVDITQELHLGYEEGIQRSMAIDEPSTDETMLDMVLNSGEDSAREEYGEDVIDRLLIRHKLAR